MFPQKLFIATLVYFGSFLWLSHSPLEAKSTFLPDWQETDIGSEGDHNKDENYCIEAEDIDGSKFYHKATSCPVPKVFDEHCPTDPDYISKCYCPEEYKLTCDAPLRGNSQYSCDGLWASCCDTTCPAGSDSNTSCYGTDVKVTVGYNGCGDSCGYCRPCNEDCTISCGYNQDATPTGSYSECGTACVSCSDRCSPAPSESGCQCGSYSDCSDGCGGLRTCCYACPTPEPEPTPTPTPTPQPDPTPTPRPDPTPTPTPTPDPTPTPSCTYSTTAASCSSQCKNVGSSSCTRNGTTYYNGCGSSKCNGSELCSNGSCIAAEKCNYSVTADSCAKQCLFNGNKSCLRNGITYYESCGGSKCINNQTCENGTCKIATTCVPEYSKSFNCAKSQGMKAEYCPYDKSYGKCVFDCTTYKSYIQSQVDTSKQMARDSLESTCGKNCQNYRVWPYSRCKNAQDILLNLAKDYKNKCGGNIAVLFSCPTSSCRNGMLGIELCGGLT